MLLKAVDAKLGISATKNDTVTSNTNATSPSHESFRCVSLQSEILGVSGSAEISHGDSRFFRLYCQPKNYVVQFAALPRIEIGVGAFVAMQSADPEDDVALAIHTLRRKADLALDAFAEANSEARCTKDVVQQGIRLLVRAVNHMLEEETLTTKKRKKEKNKQKVKEVRKAHQAVNANQAVTWICLIRSKQ